MTHNQKTLIPDEVQDIAYKKFCKLPLKHKLIVYARLVHGNSFKAQNNDLFDLNRRIVSRIFRIYIESLRDAVKKAPK
jgi:hypothetical protein